MRLFKIRTSPWELVAGMNSMLLMSARYRQAELAPTLAHHPLLTYTYMYVLLYPPRIVLYQYADYCYMVLHTSSSLISCGLFSSAGDVPTVPVHISKLVFLSFHISATAQTRGPTDSWNHGRPSHSNTNPPTLNLPTRHPQQSVPCIPAQIKRD